MRVNSGRRNHRTFSREQLATVLDANAQETCQPFCLLLGRKRNWTAQLLRHHLCCGSLLWPQTNVVVACRRAQRISPTFFFRILRRDHCSFAVAKRKLDNCQKCVQWNQGPEFPMQGLLGTVRTGARGVGPRVLASLGRRGVQAPPNRPRRRASYPSISERRSSEPFNASLVDGALGV